MITGLKAKIFLKSIWNGILGIAAEIFLVLFFIFVAFAVCLLWWSIFR